MIEIYFAISFSFRTKANLELTEHSFLSSILNIHVFFSCNQLHFRFTFSFVGYSKVVSSGLYGGIAAAPAVYGHGLGIVYV